MHDHDIGQAEIIGHGGEELAQRLYAPAEAPMPQMAMRESLDSEFFFLAAMRILPTFATSRACVPAAPCRGLPTLVALLAR